MALIIEGLLEKQLLEITKARYPHEAVGVILSDQQVVELTNYSDRPEHNFEIRREELLQALSTETDLQEVVFWHSHPHGGVGPSRVDMQQKTPFRYHLVVSLVDNHVTPSWY